MRIEIEIPEEFEVHFKRDRFEDSLRRLNADAHSIAGNYEKETSMMLIKAFKNSVVFGDLEEKHGRLIDADELISMIEGDEELISWQKHYFIELVGFCDTISDDSNNAIPDMLKKEYSQAIEDFVHELDRVAGYYSGESKNIAREDVLEIAQKLNNGHL